MPRPRPAAADMERQYFDYCAQNQASCNKPIKIQNPTRQCSTTCRPNGQGGQTCTTSCM
jgi:hypothetical protein